MRRRILANFRFPVHADRDGKRFGKRKALTNGRDLDNLSYNHLGRSTLLRRQLSCALQDAMRETSAGVESLR